MSVTGLGAIKGESWRRATNRALWEFCRRRGLPPPAGAPSPPSINSCAVAALPAALRSPALKGLRRSPPTERSFWRQSPHTSGGAGRRGAPAILPRQPRVSRGPLHPVSPEVGLHPGQSRAARSRRHQACPPRPRAGRRRRDLPRRAVQPRGAVGIGAAGSRHDRLAGGGARRACGDQRHLRGAGRSPILHPAQPPPRRSLRPAAALPPNASRSANDREE